MVNLDDKGTIMVNKILRLPNSNNFSNIVLVCSKVAQIECF